MKNRLILAALTLLAHGSLQAANLCGNIANAYGPYDYRKGATEFAINLHLVESGHFTPDVEQGIKGHTGSIGGDLDYTLRAFPNHVRALAAMARVAAKEKKLQLPGAKYFVECYFDRAIRFMPDDGAVRATYGTFLFARGQTDQALTMFSQAVELDPKNATINYNLGLAHIKKKNYEQANLYAQRAYALGFPLPGLKNMLVGAGKWDDTIEVKVPEKADEGSIPEKADEGSAPKAE